MATYRPVARLGYMGCTSVESLFEMLRPDCRFVPTACPRRACRSQFVSRTR